uniref:DB domain-containing protein n=1 Tax=Strongyloides papillosus TaxID=174720 RepID=A0A0N5BK92_STREA
MKFIVILLLTIATTFSLAKTECGTIESDYAPCIEKEKADRLFQNCCKMYAPEGCLPLCEYITDEFTSRSLIIEVLKSKKCSLKHISTVLFCASQNQDNRKCCEHLKLGDPTLGVGKRCLRFCDPSGEGIGALSKSDLTCIYNFNIPLYCGMSSIKEY